MQQASIKKVLLDLLAKGHCVTMRAGGLSMFPMLWPKMILIVEPRRLSEIKRGDIVIFEKPEADFFIAHRVVRKDGQTIITRGDSCLHNDQLVEDGQVVGVVIKAGYGKFVRSTSNVFAWIYGRSILCFSPLSHWCNHLLAKITNTALRIRGALFHKNEKR